MTDPAKAMATQLKNIQTRTGRTLAELCLFVRQSGLTKHGEIRDLLKREFGLGHGDANTLAHHARQQAEGGAASGPAAASGDVLDEIYSGAKAALRPVHDRLMEEIHRFGTFEIAPKKGYVSLRRKKQFAVIGPATNTRVEVGLNMKGVPPGDRLLALPPKGMCDYKVKLSSSAEIDAELIGWIRQAFDGSA